MEFTALIIFALAFVFIVFEPIEKSITALLGALFMIIFGVLTPDEAINAVAFETILLLVGMMMLVHMTAQSGVLSWINVRIASLTRGSPIAIFLLFSTVTAILSAFLDNVTTIIIIVPLTIQLLKGMGRDPKLYIFAEVMFSNIGGALTLIGDSSNIIIGGASGLGFVAFIQNLWIPISIVFVTMMGLIILSQRKTLCSIRGSLADLQLAFLLIEKIKYQFIKVPLKKSFIIKSLTILLLTVIGFFAVEMIHDVVPNFPEIPPFVIAIFGALLLGVAVQKDHSIHHSLENVEWTTLFFFAGLFIMVAGVEKTGVLDQLSNFVANSTDNLFYLCLLVLWMAGFVSMLLDNVPFVTVMLPVIAGMQITLQEKGISLEESTILWWALSMGACLGGNGTLVGASANVVCAGIAKKEGVDMNFLSYTAFAFPLTMVALCICSIYLYFVLN